MARPRHSFLRQVAPPLALLGVIVAGGFAAFTLLRPEERGLTSTERDWASRLTAWALSDDPSCERRPGPPPTNRLEDAWRLAGRACAGDVRWHRVWAALDPYVAWNAELGVDPADASYRSDGIAGLATLVSRRPTPVFCWGDTDWVKINAEFSAVFHGPRRVAGFFDPGRDRIHLDRRVCDGLDAFLLGGGTDTTADRSAVAGALAIVAHEAEHVRDREASEALVECRAIQRVRMLVTSRGGSARLADDIALHAWEVTYPRYDPVYGTPECKNGGPLDLRPNDPRWP